MKILLVEDDISIRKGIETFLQHNDYEVETADNGKSAYENLLENNYDIVLTDLQMPEMSGLELLENINKKKISTKVLVITAYATVENAVTAMQKGAEDFLTKPLNLTELQLKLKKLENKIQIDFENRMLKAKIENIETERLVGNSESMKELKEMIGLIGNDKNVSVFIYGESGTGKELIAKNIHKMSERSEFPFVPVNCAALPPELLESELFGYVKGAFTGAVNDKKGIFETANKGTLFLDEIGEMDLNLQAKLLRVLQDHKIKPIGATEDIQLDIRVISASNRKLKELVEENKFREDLYYRLNVMEIEAEPLRRRKDDIPLLLEYFSNKKFIQTGKKLIFEPKVIEYLKEYCWRGNIRELENLIQKLSIIVHDGKVRLENLPEDILPGNTIDANTEFIALDYQKAINKLIREFEISYLKYHLTNNSNNISKTAERIGLSRVSLHKKIREYGLLCEEA